MCDYALCLSVHVCERDTDGRPCPFSVFLDSYCSYLRLTSQEQAVPTETS